MENVRQIVERYLPGRANDDDIRAMINALESRTDRVKAQARQDGYSTGWDEGYQEGYDTGVEE
jgi:flagellar biosynthesis/type III secretory pathway protein FliH